MEPGHTPSANGKVLERNIGKNELLDLANNMRKEYTGETQLPDDGSISTTGLVAVSADNDKLALQVFERVGELLGENLCHLVAILDINLILIGGGLSASFDYILPSMKRKLNQWLTKYHASDLTIKRATLGNDAGLLEQLHCASSTKINYKQASKNSKKRLNLWAKYKIPLKMGLENERVKELFYSF
jgi:glucokinase